MNFNDINGIIILNKPKGLTSFDCVFKIRKLLGIKKAGHTGTLDPNATGVLPICLGKATKAVSMVQEGEKVYKAEIIFGIETDTYDITGNILLDNRAHLNVPNADIQNCLDKFIGEQDQVPPIYSAKKVNGKKLYEYAREGKEIEIRPSKIKIDKIDLLTYDGSRAEIRVFCSKGTYIRSLIHDIGLDLGCHATMGDLTREKTGTFSLEDAVTLDEISAGINTDNDVRELSESLNRKIIPTSRIFDFPSLTIKTDFEKNALNGTILKKEYFEDPEIFDSENTYYKIFLKSGLFIGLYELKENELKPYKMFLIDEAL